jgi:hypothetical protein
MKGKILPFPIGGLYVIAIMKLAIADRDTSLMGEGSGFHKIDGYSWRHV